MIKMNCEWDVAHFAKGEVYIAPASLKFMLGNVLLEIGGSEQTITALNDELATGGGGFILLSIGRKEPGE